jgi:putative oxidoreductase
LGPRVAEYPADRGVLPDAETLGRDLPATSLLGDFVGGAGRVDVLERYGPVVARVLISQIFLISGIMKIVDWSGTEAQMAAKGMFAIPFFHVAALLVERGAGLSLLLGYKTRLGALVLFLFLIPVTLVFHHFWTYSGQEQKINRPRPARCTRW